MIGGMRVVFSINCLESTDERLFPESRHRSRRITKKLVKRHGGAFRKRPCMFKSGDTIYAHPIYKSQLEAAFKDQSAGAA
jgi:hypothetical protein